MIGLIWAWLAIQAIIIGIYFWRTGRLKNQKVAAPSRIYNSRQQREESKEMRELRLMRAKSLNLPLSERARPAAMEDIVGQQDGIMALRAALCGPNPQHVIIYGPPGCGKTCAARLILEEAKRQKASPFNADSKFVEMDATCVRFDERAIADPLMGSVHDPIYQGAGHLGTQGVPQPKPGAVSRAHCGVLFLDEIGELHPIQMNKLLKVLEDRKVFFDSAYYSPDNQAIPPYIHDIFQNGMPADFRLVGATTRQPEELPAALRSRCVELFFRPLSIESLEKIAQDAANRLGYEMDERAREACAIFCGSGREVVNMIQIAGGAAYAENRGNIALRDIEWVTEITNCSRRYAYKMPEKMKPGTAVGLAVANGWTGVAMEIECMTEPAEKGRGTLFIGGAADYEEFDLRGRKLGRKSTAYVSAENVCCAFKKRFCVDCSDYHIRYNVPGGIPMDGPSAGIAFAVALMSALTGKAAEPGIALTGEITVYGEVRAVGGVREKILAAKAAGADTVVIPKANWESGYETMGISVVAAEDVSEVMHTAFHVPYDTRNDAVLPFLYTTA